VNNKLHKDVEEITRVLICGTILELDCRDGQKPQPRIILRYTSVQSHLCFQETHPPKLCNSQLKYIFSGDLLPFRGQQYIHVLKVYDEHFHSSSQL
jgi:hypothetical protein